ncbi:MAG TPA: GNAT family N-acetyltransferase [Polyangiaceae bacterium]
MAALTVPSRVVVRAPRPGDGVAVAKLWRELWDVHESWGGYPGAKDDLTYARVQTRIEQEARARQGSIALGRHLHLVATLDGEVVGQVEGWSDRYGIDATTPATCEVRSLIVMPEARNCGAGAALLEGLGREAVDHAGGPTVLAAEVLEPNPAHSFYARCGYAPIAYNVRRTTARVRDAWPERARVAQPRDALPIAILEAALAQRRKRVGDARFDPPRAVDAAWLGAITAHLQTGGQMPVDLVALDAQNAVRASATLLVMTLDPPFLPVRRAALTRTSVDPALDPTPLVAELVELGVQIASRWGASTLEITDLSAPGTPLHDAALRTGATPWSRVVTKSWR